MAKYRKKPVEVDAEILNTFLRCGRCGHDPLCLDCKRAGVIVCKPDIFEQTYELIESCENCKYACKGKMRTDRDPGLSPLPPDVKIFCYGFVPQTEQTYEVVE